MPDTPETRLPEQRLTAVARLWGLEEAKAFLRQHIAGGPQPAGTLHRAKDLLGVRTERAGGYAERGQWIWYPPTSVAALASSPPGFGAAGGASLPLSTATWNMC
jgi:hypothetical protein